MRLVFCLVALAAPAVLAAETGDAAAIRAVLDSQVSAWNRGDLPEFMRTYDAETVFVGKEITRGNAGLLERYRQKYPTREQMGTLTFTGIEVKLLGCDHASVLGRYQLERSPAGGGSAQGMFTLLLRRTGGRWAIILDHSS